MRLHDPRQLLVIFALAAAALATGCATPQIHGATQALALNLKDGALQKGGLAFVTPSSVTGQEEDKQALALVFAEVIRQERPGTHIVALPEALSAINRSGLTGDYRRMLEDYRLTGIFDRDVLTRVGTVTGARYIAQLKLAGFRQDSSNRWSLLGLRIVDTRSTTLRLFIQIWDSQDGSIAWEGSDELTSARDYLEERTVTFRSAVAESARRLVLQLP